MLGLIDGFRVSQIVSAAAALAIPDLLSEGPRTAEDLAVRTQTHAPSLARLLRALAALGVLSEGDAGFALTAVGATMRSDAPGSLRPWALLALGEESQRAWGNLLHTVRTGETAFDHAFGMSVWEHRQRHLEHGRLFDAAMGALMAHATAAFVAACPVADVKRLVDVGGGDGTLLIALLRAYPHLEGALYDLPDVAERGRRRIFEAGLASRCTALAGDALDLVPEGADCYLLARVIHDWDDERATAILRNCQRAMPARGKLILFERIVPAYGQSPSAARAAALTDVTMMIFTGGRERSEAEYGALLAAAGLRPTGLIATPSGLSIIECRRLDERPAAFRPSGA